MPQSITSLGNFEQSSPEIQETGVETSPQNIPEIGKNTEASPVGTLPEAAPAPVVDISTSETLPDHPVNPKDSITSLANEEESHFRQEVQEEKLPHGSA